MHGIEAVLQTRNEQERRKITIQKSLRLEVSNYMSDAFVGQGGKRGLPFHSHTFS